MGNKQKINHTTVCQNKIDGAPKMSDLDKFIKSLK